MQWLQTLVALEMQLTTMTDTIPGYTLGVHSAGELPTIDGRPLNQVLLLNQEGFPSSEFVFSLLNYVYLT